MAWPKASPGAAAPGTGPSATPARRQAIHAPSAPAATAPGKPILPSQMRSTAVPSAGLPVPPGGHLQRDEDARDDAERVGADWQGAEVPEPAGRTREEGHRHVQ